MELAAYLTPKIVLSLHVLGLLSAVHAARYARTSQGAIAWVFALILFPYLALFFYWILGPRKFDGYLLELESAREIYFDEMVEYRTAVIEHEEEVKGDKQPSARLLESLNPWRATGGNELELLIDGEATFEAIFKAIDSAKDYLLIQFYIWRDDEIGREVKKRLLAKLEQGVKVYCLADTVGSMYLSSAYVNELEAAGVRFAFFGSKGFFGRYSINFRNHRKAVIVDGHTAFVGGLNIGDEYLGRSANFGNWRDSHIRVTGPAVQVIQSSFMADYYFSTKETLPVARTPKRSESGNAVVLPLSTGPTSDLEDCSLMFMEAIASAKKRFWIASPYFVPDEPLTQALQMAALRGRDVRVILPKKPDHLLVWYASFSYIAQMLEAGVRIYHYDTGFLHQKAFLVDDDLSCVGTANLDNRSLRLNFELSILVFDREFTSEVERMFLADLENSTEFLEEDYEMLPKPMLIASAVSRLASPIL